MAVLLIYRPVLHGEFVYDDHWYIVRNPFVHHDLSLRSLITDSRTTAARSSGLSADVYRPLATLWFWIDAHLWGPNTLPWHLENLLLHIANGLLLFALLLRWIKSAGAALMGTAVFLLHPVQAQSVAWITQRSSLASATCLLAGLSLLLGDPPLPRVRCSMGIICATIALLFRETSVILPLLFVVMMFASKQNSRPKGTLLWLIMLSTLYLLARYAVLRQWSQLPEQRESWIENMGSGVLAFPVYLGKMILPLKLRVSYSYPPLDPVSLGLSFLVWIVYAISIFVFMRRDGWTTVGLLWIIIGLLPVLQIVPMRAFVAERFLYVPIIGLAIIVCRVANYRLGPWLCVPWLLFLVVTTLRAIPAWRNEGSLWAEAIRQEPANAFAHICYGTTLKDPAAAAAQYRQALLANPNADMRYAAVNNLVNVLLLQGKNTAALIWARKAVQQRPDSTETLYNLGQASLRAGHRQESVSALERLERLAGTEAESVHSLQKEMKGLSSSKKRTP